MPQLPLKIREEGLPYGTRTTDHSCVVRNSSEDSSRVRHYGSFVRTTPVTFDWTTTPESWNI